MTNDKRFDFSASNFATGVRLPRGAGRRVVAYADATGIKRLPKRAVKLWGRLAQAGKEGIPLPEAASDRWLVRCLIKCEMCRVVAEGKPARKRKAKVTPESAAMSEAVAAA